MNTLFLTVLVVFLFCLISDSFSVTSPLPFVFVEENSLVVFEAESAIKVTNDWQEHTPTLDGARDTALRFTGGTNICWSSPKNAAEFIPLEYPFRINNAGTYRLYTNGLKQVHCVEKGPGGGCHDGAGCESLGLTQPCAEGQCWRTDISNDAFMQLAKANGEFVPVEGINDKEIVKMFVGSDGSKYAWTSDKSYDKGGKHNPDYNLEAGDYVLLVRGRSSSYCIDRFYLVGTNVDNLRIGRDAPESQKASDFPQEKPEDMPTESKDMPTNMSEQKTEGMTPKTEIMSENKTEDMPTNMSEKKTEDMSASVPEKKQTKEVSEENESISSRIGVPIVVLLFILFMY